jgi:pimeloyl-ACP methyl ester carboxylesterase
MTSLGMEEGGKKQQHHFVLIHDVCHGAWSWYRVPTALAAAGHRVTALDMAGCGEEVASFEEYSRSLLGAVAALPEGEKVVLVAHSFGGQSLALAMERHPEKVTVAVFVTATMPAAGNPMAVYAFMQVPHTNSYFLLPLSQLSLFFSPPLAFSLKSHQPQSRIHFMVNEFEKIIV